MLSIEDSATSLAVGQIEESPVREKSASEIADSQFVSLLLSMRKTATCTSEDIQSEDTQFAGKICSIPSSNSLIGSGHDLPMDNSFTEINELDESSDSEQDKQNPSHISNDKLNSYNSRNQQLQANKEVDPQPPHCQEDSTTIVISTQEEKIFQWLDSEGIMHVKPEDKMAVYFEERKKIVTQKFRAGLTLGFSTSSHTLNAATPIASSNSLWERRKLAERTIDRTSAQPQSCLDLESCQNPKKSLNYFSSSYDL